MTTKITLVPPGGRQEITGEEIPIGTAFKGEIGEYSSLFLRTYDGVVDLSNPGQTWDNPPVEKYEPVTIRITIKKEHPANPG